MLYTVNCKTDDVVFSTTDKAEAVNKARELCQATGFVSGVAEHRSNGDQWLVARFLGGATKAARLDFYQ